MLKKILFTVRNSQFTQFAFTLAETLIVMGIIGVVAALTLPNLNSSTGDKEKVVKLQKIYQNLNDAYGRATAVYGPIEEWVDSNGNLSEKRLGERITEFMKVSKICNGTKGCFSNSGYAKDIDESPYFYKCILADGTSIAFDIDNDDCIFWVDIDGQGKGQAELAYDIFVFYVNYRKQNGELHPYGDGDTFVSEDACPKYKDKECSAWVVRHGNMDYLKANNSGKCNNSSVTLDGVSNTSCK